MPLASPDGDGGMAALPAELIDALAGTWTNSNGDELAIEPNGSGTFHGFTGSVPSSTGPQSCASYDHVTVTTHISIATEDGRLDEDTGVELILRQGTGHFVATLPLTSLSGNFEPMEQQTGGSLQITADYGVSGAVWDLTASIPFAVEPGAGSGFGGAAELIYLAPFQTRISPTTGGDAASAF